MKCNGKYDNCGANCDTCNRLMDDCEGHPDYEFNENMEWVEVENEND